MASQAVITKVYFPRLIVPLASIAVAVVDFGIAFLVLVVMMIWYGVGLRPEIALLPLFLALTILAAVSAGLWLSALNARYRDVRYAIPFLTQIRLFLSPIAYPASMVPERFRWLYGLNPMAGTVEGFRWALPGFSRAASRHDGDVAFVVLCLLAGGLVYFRKTERTIADVYLGRQG